MGGKTIPISITLLFFALTCFRTAAAQDDIVLTKQQWIERLNGIANSRDVRVLTELNRCEPDFVYQVLREGWGRFPTNGVKNEICRSIAEGWAEIPVIDGWKTDQKPVNPYLMDILELCMSDTSPAVRSAAKECIAFISTVSISDAAEFKKWRARMGNRSLEEITGASFQDAARKLIKADDANKVDLMKVLLHYRYYNGIYEHSINDAYSRGVTAPGLDGTRRRAVLDSGLTVELISCLKRNHSPQINSLAFSLLAQILPEPESLVSAENDIRKTAAAQIGRREFDPKWLALLAPLKPEQDGALLLKFLQSATNESSIHTLSRALGRMGYLKAIPTLISLYDSLEVTTGFTTSIDGALADLTNTHYHGRIEHSADWWRQWWDANKKLFPPDVAAAPYPRSTGLGKSHIGFGFSLAKGRREHLIDGDPALRYWLLSPGILSSGQNARLQNFRSIPAPVDTQGKQHLPAVNSKASAKPGLIVVLTDWDASDSVQQSFWLQVAEFSAGKNYLIALAAIPPPRDGQTSMLKATSTPVLDPKYQIENFVGAITKEVMANIEINSTSIFLIGEGHAGVSVYACSLQKKTPFRGFGISGAPFRSAQLPPLAMAKARRYLILHDPKDKGVPFFLASAAADLLKKQGAIVRLVPFSEETTEDKSVHRVDVLKSAIRWLDTIPPK